MGAVGGALAGISKEASQLAIEHYNSVNRTKVLDAESYFHGIEGVIGQKLSEQPDTLLWAGIVSEDVKKAQEEALKDKTLSQATRDEITTLGARWGRDMHRTVETRAATRAFENEGHSMMGKVLDDQRDGNFSRPVGTINEMVRRGLIHQDEGSRLLTQNKSLGEAADLKAQAAAVYDEARRDPQGWLERNKERPKDMPVSVHERGVNEAHQTIRAGLAATADELEEKVFSGELKVPGDVDDWAKAHPGTPSRLKEQLKALLVRRQDATAKATMEANAPEIAGRLDVDVEKFDPATATAEEYYELRMKIAELPAALRTEVMKPLEAKWLGKEGSADSDLMATAKAEVWSMVRNGDFGGIDSNKVVKVDDVDPLTGNLGSKYALKSIRDEKAYQQVRRQVGEILGKYRRWLKKNPNPKPGEPEAYFDSLVPNATRVKRQQRLQDEAFESKRTAAVAPPAPPPRKPPGRPMAAGEPPLPGDEFDSNAVGGDNMLTADYPELEEEEQ